jgi:ferritin-like protein
MRVRETPDLDTRARPGDISWRAGVSGLQARGVDLAGLRTRLTTLGLADRAAEYAWSASGRHLLRSHPASKQCERLARRCRRSFELCSTRLHELGGSMPPLAEGVNGGDPAVGFPQTPAGVLIGLLESERAALRGWWELCDLSAGGDFRTLQLAQRVLGWRIEHETLLIDVLAGLERGGEDHDPAG